MAVKLVKTQLPKTGGGRQPIPLDQETADALVSAFAKPEDRMDNGRPVTLGTGDTYPTKGRANTMGRKYADHVSEALNVKVGTQVYWDGKDEGKEAKPPFRWRIWIRPGETLEEPESES